MRVAIFCHSLLSDWNHGNAHFLRGVATELVTRGHEVRTFEPRDAWSVANLVAERGPSALDETRQVYPKLEPERYEPASFDVDRALDGADLVLVHEWNDPALVARIGRHRVRGGRELLLFHDTHHRMVTAPEQMRSYDLSGYDAVLAFGGVLRDLYLSRGLAARAYTWHEAADVRVFSPREATETNGDVVFVGNWGDEERAAELGEFLLDPVRSLGLIGSVHGVRYPASALARIGRAGLVHRGWLPNYRVPEAFARHRVTIHVPRRPYAAALPGIPTIRPFEALACGIPLVSAPWDDAERLFRAGHDYLLARSPAEMREHLRALLHDRDLANGLSEHGRRCILARHTCAHRADELFAIAAELRAGAAPSTSEPRAKGRGTA